MSGAKVAPTDGTGDQTNIERIKHVIDDVEGAVEDAAENAAKKTIKLIDRLEKGLKNITNVETPAADANYLPFGCQLTTFSVYVSCIIACGVLLMWYGYTTNRSDTFMSLDPKAGNCKTDRTLKTCCPIEKEVSGTYLVDTSHAYDSDDDFEYGNQIYTLTLLGLLAEPRSWSRIVRTIKSDVALVAGRASFRDYAWNMVAWSSYSYYAAGLSTGGIVQFSLSGNVGMIFNKPIITAGYASNYTNHVVYYNTSQPGVTAANYTYSCKLSIQSVFNSNSRLLSVTQDLDARADTCKRSRSTGGYNCANPCPKIMALQAMGYNALTAQSTSFTWSVDMASVMTAIAVNYGILRLEFLENFENDANRLSLLTKMLNAGLIDRTTFRQTSSYFDFSYAPMAPIYCINYGKVTPPGASRSRTSASCLVRVGDLLMYPIIQSYGWTPTGFGYPKPCQNTTADDVSGPKFQEQAQYYCNQHNLVVGFIYYPVEDTDLLKALREEFSSYFPSYYFDDDDNNNNNDDNNNVSDDSPSSTPSSFPTFGDTEEPTVLPTATPSNTPAAGPTPTAVPIFAPTNSPAASPTTAVPTADPTEEPSPEPTSFPSESVRRIRHRALRSRDGIPDISSTYDDGSDSNRPMVNADYSDVVLDEIYGFEERETEGPFDLVAEEEVDIVSISQVLRKKQKMQLHIKMTDPQATQQYISAESASEGFVHPHPRHHTRDSHHQRQTPDPQAQDQRKPRGNRKSQRPQTKKPNRKSPSDEIHIKDYEAFDDDVDFSYSSEPTLSPASTPSTWSTDTTLKGTNLTSYDNGLIFAFAKMAATKRSALPWSGDAYVPGQGYRAMISALLWKTQNNKTTFADDFKLLCDPSTTGVAGGCAMFSIQFNGAADRTMSIFNLQPGGNTPAFNNSIFHPAVFDHIARYPPSQLIEKYYDCVYTPFKAFYLSAGVAISNTQVAVAIFMLVYMYVLVFFYRYVRGANDVEFKPMKLRVKRHHERLRESVVEKLIENLRASTAHKSEGWPSPPQALLAGLDEVVRKFDEEEELAKKQSEQKAGTAKGFLALIASGLTGKEDEGDDDEDEGKPGQKVSNTKAKNNPVTLAKGVSGDVKAFADSSKDGSVAVTQQPHAGISKEVEQLEVNSFQSEI